MRGRAIDALAGVLIAVGARATRGSICPNRSSTPLTPKSGEHDDQIAPIDVAASIAITVSAMLGRIRQRDRRARRPLRACADAARATCRRSCAKRQATLAAFLVPRHNGGIVIAVAQQVLGKIESRLREPVRPRAPDPAEPCGLRPAAQSPTALRAILARRPSSPPRARLSARRLRDSRPTTLAADDCR